VTLCIAGWFLLPSEEYGLLGKRTFAALGFASDFVLWVEAGYFDTSSEAKPLLHLWSLAIEEQFYLLWPLVLGLYMNSRQIFKVVLVGTLLISFVINLISKPHCFCRLASPVIYDKSPYWFLSTSRIFAQTASHV
jgi:peptidoglycan/LPS O-acetylase OafA/YrhL